VLDGNVEEEEEDAEERTVGERLDRRSAPAPRPEEDGDGEDGGGLVAVVTAGESVDGVSRSAIGDGDIVAVAGGGEDKLSRSICAVGTAAVTAVGESGDEVTAVEGGTAAEGLDEGTTKSSNRST